MDAALPSLTQETVGGFRWSLLPGLRTQLLDEDGLRLREWLASGQARVVKHGPHRIVYRVELPGLCFYIKHNLVHDQRTWLRHLVRPSKARVEFERVTAAANRGIPTISPLALAEEDTHIGSGESILVTRNLDGCIPLHYYLAAVLPKLPEPRASHMRQQLAAALGKFVARIHDAGILHHDLHAANLLVRVNDSGAIDLFVIDLLAVDVGPPLDWKQSLDNLVLINCWFSYRVHRADRLRFWKAYYQARRLGPWRRDPFGGKPYLLDLPEIETKTWTRNLAFWLRRDKRCLLNNRYYRRVFGNGVVGHAITDVDPKDLDALLRDPDAPFRQPDVGVLKESPSSSVVEMDFRIRGVVRRVIYKRFRVSSWKDPLASLVRHTPAMRSWIHGQGFRERGLATARPFVVLHRRTCGMYQEGYLLTEKIGHACDLHEFMSSLETLLSFRRQTLLRQLVERVARTIRNLHQRQLSHRDLKAANILVRRWDAPPDEPSAYSQDIHNLLYMPESAVWLIDLVGVERFAELSQYRRVQNLSRLNASFYASKKITRTDRLRFLLTYLNCGAFGRCDWKSWWRKIDRATLRKVERNKRRGKALK